MYLDLPSKQIQPAYDVKTIDNVPLSYSFMKQNKQLTFIVPYSISPQDVPPDNVPLKFAFLVPESKGFTKYEINLE